MLDYISANNPPNPTFFFALMGFSCRPTRKDVKNRLQPSLAERSPLPAQFPPQGRGKPRVLAPGDGDIILTVFRLMTGS